MNKLKKSLKKIDKMLFESLQKGRKDVFSKQLKDHPQKQEISEFAAKALQNKKLGNFIGWITVGILAVVSLGTIIFLFV
jgi:membrane-bound acyltransferase YfiQ involved in biofilm formation